MSELTTYYAHRGDLEAVEALLRETQGGAILEGGDTWFVFVAPDDAGDALVEANRGLLVRVDYAGDHGLWVRAYRDARELGAIELVWDPEPDSQVAPEVLDALGAAESMRARVRECAASTLSPEQGDRIRATVLAALGVPNLPWVNARIFEVWGDADRARFPGARHIAPAEPAQVAGDAAGPNAWCDVPGQPEYMYLPVPEVTVTEEHRAMARRHFDYDIHDHELRLYERWRRALPRELRYLADRVMGCRAAMYEWPRWEQAKRETIETILALTWDDVDWEAVSAKIGA